MVKKSERESYWYQFGTDKQFLAWVRKQPSAVSGDEYNIVPAHYRTAQNSGTATKPPYSAVPMTYAEHQEQHRIGQYAFKPREWWELQVELHLLRWRDSVRHNNNS